MDEPADHTADEEETPSPEASQKKQQAFKLREVSPEELQTILEEHGRWLKSEDYKKWVKAKRQKYEKGRANLSVCNLQEANLSYADLTGAKSLAQEQINTACVPADTKLPEGLTRPKPC